MLDFTALVGFLGTFLSGPWLPVVMVLVYFGWGWLRSRNPSLPELPPLPTLPVDKPVVPVAPQFPVLSALVNALFKLKGLPAPPSVLHLSADDLSNLWSEIDAAVDAKAAKTQEELKNLQ